jgi:hypothetical protein
MYYVFYSDCNCSILYAEVFKEIRRRRKARVGDGRTQRKENRLCNCAKAFDLPHLALIFQLRKQGSNKSMLYQHYGDLASVCIFISDSFCFCGWSLNFT